MSVNERTCSVCGQDLSSADDACPNCGTWIGPVDQITEDITEEEVIPTDEGEEDVSCPRCGGTHPQDAEYCPVTGERIEKETPSQISCLQCGKQIKPGVPFCPFCGANQHPIPNVVEDKVPEKVGQQIDPNLVRKAGIAFVMILLLGSLFYGSWWLISQGKSGNGPLAMIWITKTPTRMPSPTPTHTITATAKNNHTPTATTSPTDPGLQFTAAAQTLEAQRTEEALLTQNAATATQTPVPPTPTRTPTTTPTQTPTMTFTPTEVPLGGGGLIAFQSNRSGNNDIYVMSSNGKNVTRLTTSPYDDRAPSWSPDGKEIAFQSNSDGDYEIYVVNLETKGIRQITSNGCDDYAPSWSPDGKRFVFYSTCSGNREIFIMDTNGSNRRQLTQTSNTYNWFPSWHPDGNLIAFSSNRSGGYHVYTMRPDGTGVQDLGPGCVPFFAPNGNRIIYAQYCTDYGNIMLMKADGTNARSLTDGQDENKNPVWSRDGEKIVFQSQISGNDEIWMMDVDGSNWIQLTDDSASDGVPVWQPGTRSVSESSSILPTLTSSPELINTLLSPIDGMEMVLIPAGEFLMGSTSEDINQFIEMCPECDEGSLRDQLPQHKVYLDDYWIDRTEITNTQFLKFVTATGYQTTAEQLGKAYVMHQGGNKFETVDGANWRHPFGGNSSIDNKTNAAVTQISWDDASAYCRWAGRRLPTEAEWEKAARGTDGRYFPWGNDYPSANLLNFNYMNNGPITVGSFPDSASPFGILDMAGNVWEWVSDFYGETYYHNSAYANPRGPSNGEGHSFRGGSWASELRIEMVNVTSVFRFWNYPYLRSNILGIRCAMDA